MECKSFRENGDALRKFDVIYYGANCDTAEINKKFSESFDLDFPILSDPDQSVAEKYGVVTEKRRFPFRWTFYVGTDGKILYIDKNVNVTTHGKDVADKLEALEIKSKEK